MRRSILSEELLLKYGVGNYRLYSSSGRWSYAAGHSQWSCSNPVGLLPSSLGGIPVKEQTEIVTGGAWISTGLSSQALWTLDDAPPSPPLPSPPHTHTHLWRLVIKQQISGEDKPSLMPSMNPSSSLAQPSHFAHLQRNEPPHNSGYILTVW